MVASERLSEATQATEYKGPAEPHRLRNTWHVALPGSAAQLSSPFPLLAWHAPTGKAASAHQKVARWQAMLCCALTSLWIWTASAGSMCCGPMNQRGSSARHGQRCWGWAQVRHREGSFSHAARRHGNGRFVVDPSEVQGGEVVTCVGKHGQPGQQFPPLPVSTHSPTAQPRRAYMRRWGWQPGQRAPAALQSP